MFGIEKYAASFSGVDSHREYKKSVIEKNSREHWRNICGREISAYLKSCGTSDGSIASAFEIIEDLCLETDSSNMSRDLMADFVDVFVFLVKCAQSTDVNVRRRAQTLLRHLLANFEFVAQQLLLCRIFELVVDKSVDLEMEPQVLAWLVDIYRQRLHDSNGECQRIFGAELSHFYGQICAIAYEDLPNSHHFHVAVLLLLRDQATKRINLPLLRRMRTTLLDKYQTQLADFLQLRRLQSSANDAGGEHSSSSSSSASDFLGVEPSFALELLKFTLSDTSNAIRNALG